MRLVTFEQGDAGERRLGVVQGEGVVDLQELDAADLPGTMLDLIQEDRLFAVSGAVEQAQPGAIPLGQVRLCAPIPRPTENVICLGRNYQEHAVESARATGQEVARPTFFTKAVTTINGPNDDIPFNPEVSAQIDWEVELGVIIGRTARNVSRQDALDHIFGYTVLNDVSARDLQYGYGGQFFYGKSLDGSCPLGPCIVTGDEIGDPQNLNLRLRVNGEEKQNANTRDMIFGVAEIVEILSRAMTLLPGQIIATGTPAGVGHARQPPEFLKPGDVMESEIEGIGTLRNRVVRV